MVTRGKSRDADTAGVRSDEGPAYDVLEGGGRVAFYGHELRRIAALALRYPDSETGGDLFGLWTFEQQPVVQAMIDAGRDARHGRVSFFQDAGHMDLCGSVLYRRHSLLHMGEWHSHHQLGLTCPSTGDVTTIFRNLQRSKIPRFLLLIATLSRADGAAARPAVGAARVPVVRLDAFLFENATQSVRRCVFNVLDGDSPVYGDHELANMLVAHSERPLCASEWIALPLPSIVRELDDGIVMDVEVSGQWYSTPRGTELLQAMTAELKRRDFNCDMRRDQAGASALTLAISTRQGRGVLITLPQRFPRDTGVVAVDAKSQTTPPSWPPWEKWYQTNYPKLPPAATDRVAAVSLLFASWADALVGNGSRSQ